MLQKSSPLPAGSAAAVPGGRSDLRRMQGIPRRLDGVYEQALPSGAEPTVITVLQHSLRIPGFRPAFQVRLQISPYPARMVCRR